MRYACYRRFSREHKKRTKLGAISSMTCRIFISGEIRIILNCPDEYRDMELGLSCRVGEASMANESGTSAMVEVLRLNFLERREAECRAMAADIAEPSIRTEYLRFADQYAQEARGLRDRLVVQDRQAARLAAIAT